MIDELKKYQETNYYPYQVFDIFKIFQEELKPHLNDFKSYLSNRENSRYIKELVNHIMEIDPQSDLKGYGLFISDFLPKDGLKISICYSNYKERIALHRFLWRIMKIEYYEARYQEYGDFYLNRLIQRCPEITHKGIYRMSFKSFHEVIERV